jgi:hypothetical protein
VGAGRYVSPDSGKSGSYVSKGTEWGLGYGFGPTFGWFPGDGKDLFCGAGNSINVMTPLTTVSINFSDGHFAGISLSFGPGIPGFTANETNTTDYPDN